VSGFLGFSIAAHGSLMDHSLQFGRLGGYLKNVWVPLNIIWLSAVRVIWTARNRKIFQHKEDHLEILRVCLD